LSGMRAIGMISKSCSEPTLGLLVVGLMAAGLLAAPGGAGRGRGTRPPEIAAPTAGAQQAKPGDAGKPGGTSERQSAEGDQIEAIVLPGQNRTLPSEDPRNQGEAPEATPSGTAVQTVPAVPAGESGETRSGPIPARASASNEPPTVPSHLPPPIPPGESRFRVQVLASTSPVNAFRLREEIQETLGLAVFVEQEQGISKVRVGDLEERAEAETLRRRLFGLGYQDAFVVECRGR
jgi:hypothetical protein